MPSPDTRALIIDCIIHVRNPVLEGLWSEIMSSCDNYGNKLLSIYNYLVYMIQQVYDPLN